jgi:transforming growth factor-beta-induced protein
MKNLRSLAILFLGLTLSFNFVACSDDDDDDDVQPTTTNNNNSSQQNIAEIAIESDQTDSLVVALTRAGLVSTFQGSGNFTVFAPNNIAFANYISATAGVNSIADIDSTDLANILLYHVLDSEVKSSALSNNMYAATMNSKGPGNEETSVLINTQPSVMLNANATVQTADIDASNGVIHIIDDLVTPRNVVELAQNDNRFDSLVVAVLQAGLAGTLSSTNSITVFAPTNQAFVDYIGNTTGVNSIADISSNDLDAVLKYHVHVQANVQSDQLTNGMSISTLGTGSLTVDLSNGAQLTTATSQTVNIIVTDVQGTNGVIHAVDKVMLPQ